MAVPDLEQRLKRLENDLNRREASDARNGCGLFVLLMAAAMAAYVWPWIYLDFWVAFCRAVVATGMQGG